MYHILFSSILHVSPLIKSQKSHPETAISILLLPSLSPGFNYRLAHQVHHVSHIVPTWSITSCHVHSIDRCHALLPALESNMVSVSVCFLGRVVFSFFFGFCSASISVFVFLWHSCLSKYPATVPSVTLISQTVTTHLLPVCRINYKK